MKSKIKVYQQNNLELVSKTILKFIVVFLLVAQNSFATNNPIPGIGIVIKKNPGGGSITVLTGNGGGFSTQLSEGVYELSFQQDQLQTSINGIVKANYPKKTYQYDGSGVEFILDNSQIKVNSKGLEGNRFSVDNQNSITITVPKSGATLSGKLSWDDAVMNYSKTCPDGFTMQNGECIPNNISENQQARTESTPIKGISVKAGHNPKPTMTVSLNANGGTSSSKGVTSGLSFNPSLGIAIHWKNSGIGFDAGTFNTKPSFDLDAYAAPLKNIDVLTITNSKNNWSSVYLLIGPHYEFSLTAPETGARVKPFHNKVTLKMGFQAGVTLAKAPEFSIVTSSPPDTTPPNGNINTTPINVASYKAPATYKSNVLTLKPSMTLTYWMSNNFALTANAQYLMQSGQQEFTTVYRDLSKVDFTNILRAQEQISAAPKIVAKTKGPDTFMSFGIGVTYSFRKGWDGSIKGNRTNGEGHFKTITASKQTDLLDTNEPTQDKGINEKGLKKNEGAYSITNTEKKQISEALVTFRKGNDADVKATAETLVTIARKGWDGSIKGNKTVNLTNEADVKTIAETLVNIRKGWDGSIKGTKTENQTNDADLKTIGETLVNLRKGWDGSIKGNKTNGNFHFKTLESSK